MSAAQAARLIELASVEDRKAIGLAHVVCSRVLDKWNMTEAEHSQVACYYGWTPAFLLRLLHKTSFIANEGEGSGTALTLSTLEIQTRVLEEQSAHEQGSPPLISRELQNRVLAHMGKSDHQIYAHSSQLAGFAAQLIASNLCAGTSEDVETCAVCLEACHLGCARWTCKRCSHSLHWACHRDWSVKCASADDDDDDDAVEDESEVLDGSTLEKATCPYCRAKATPKRFKGGCDAASAWAWRK